MCVFAKCLEMPN